MCPFSYVPFPVPSRPGTEVFCPVSREIYFREIWNVYLYLTDFFSSVFLGVAAQVNPMVADVTGKSVLVTRYFKALRPPPELIENEEPLAAAEKVSWFVSLIPYMPSNILFPGLQVCCTLYQLSFSSASSLEGTIFICS